MKKNNLIRFAQSLVLLPVMTMSLSLGSIHNIETSRNALVQKVNIEAGGTFALNQAIDPKAGLNTQILKARAEAIDAYFAERNMPLAGTGMKMAKEADTNDIDWRLLPAIAVRESTGGKFDCKKVENNPFGWGSCKISFNSTEEAIETVARNLGGNNPNTSHHYDNKTIKQILRAYNPPSIVPRYAEQVMAIMNAIGDTEIIPGISTSSSDLSVQKA
ncbi:MAG: hypothetical protein AAB902_02800 [Patescibacteria group bacterium]